MEVISLLKLIGLLLPPLIDLVNRKVKNEEARLWISVGFCVLLGVGVHFVGGGDYREVDAIAESILVIFGLSQISFKAYWKESGVRKRIFGKDIAKR